MVQFWLNNLLDLFNTQNLTFLNNDIKPENYIKVLNLIALLSIVLGVSITFIKKDALYFSITVVILSLTILIKSNISKVSSFVPISKVTSLTNAYDTGVYLTKAIKNDPSGLNNIIYVNTSLNFKKGEEIKSIR